MKLVRVDGLLPQLDELIAACCLNGDFHPEPAVQHMCGSLGYVTLSEDNPYTPDVQQMEELFRLAGQTELPAVTGKPRHIRDEEFELVHQVARQLQDLSAERDALVDEKNKLAQQRDQFAHFSGLDVPLENILGCEYIKIRFGFLPKASYARMTVAYAENPHVLFVTCGEGGGTGTGASPIVARAAHQQGALTIAVVTRPFSFEGPQRSASAEYGIDNLRKEVDALIVIPNDRLLELSDRSIGIIEAFKTADTALLAGVQGITDLISMNSYIHVDFNDVNSILRGAGTALFGIGSARGEDRATQAAEIAISSPLLEESIEGAHGALINIAGPTDLKLQEASAATELVRKAIHPEAQIIWGLALDDAYGDEVRVTVIAAGFDPVAAQDDDTQSTVTPVVPTAADPATPVAQPAPAPAPAAQPAATAQPAFTPATGDSASLPFDDPTSAHPNIAVNDPAGDLDIPDFLR